MGCGRDGLDAKDRNGEGRNKGRGSELCNVETDKQRGDVDEEGRKGRSVNGEKR